jgi:type IV secretory pathway TraG/TraD family ATPase VirD4
LFFSPKDYETASEISKLAGRKTILTLSHSQSAGRAGDDWSGISVGETGMDVLTPHQAMGLECDRIIAFAPGLVPNVMILRAPNYWEYRDIQRLTDANPYAPGYRPPRASMPPQPRPGHQGESLQSKIERWRKTHKP